MRLTVVGCSGSYPGPDNPASCYLLEADGFRLVVDMGNGGLGALQKYIGLYDVDAVALSHLHADHCVDLYSYAIARTYGSPDGVKPSIPVYAPAGARERLAGIHGEGDAGEVLDRFRYETFQPGRTEIGPFAVTAARMNHPVETYGLRFSHDGVSIAYSGDTGETGELLALARDANVLLCEASFTERPGLPGDLHLTSRQAAGYAERAETGGLLLTHLQSWVQPETSLSEAATVYSGGLDLARPGQIVEL
ncbi:MAG: MBL fold metallo-hydrolase [Streptosporangiales bacterium]|nr:MBL fold metallo-hydrolase [Streptosporangiales bacterium]